MSTKHTPGPWTARQARTLIHIVEGVTVSISAKHVQPAERRAYIEQKKADAHLIASAPAMFEALKAHVEYERASQAHSAYVVTSVVDSTGERAEMERLKALMNERFERFLNLRTAALAQAEPAEALRLAGEEVGQ